MRPIQEIAATIGLDETSIVPYGHYKAKIPLESVDTSGSRGKMIVVTGITPTRAGEGKTTVTVGLTQGLGKLGQKVIANLREPSLGPIFGIKGGGTGGGKTTVMPDDEINIHFTGDAHAVGSAHNLLAALTDNAAQRGQIQGFGPENITWRRVTDVEDRALRTIMTGIGGEANAPVRETGFDIVTASEVMAILALASGLEDLRARIARIVVGFTRDGRPVTADDVGAVGSMMSLLRYAIQPNLVQTAEGQPVMVHAGPFGNIAHGCSSVVADKLGLALADYVVTEAGFGADLGFEKFMHIKARFNDVEPHAAVIVASVKALKSHAGIPLSQLNEGNPRAVVDGMPNLLHLIGVIRSFNLPVVVAVNRFPADTDEEIATVRQAVDGLDGVQSAESRGFIEGGDGCLELARAVMDASAGEKPEISYLYPEDATTEEKVLALAQKVYNADDVAWAPAARRRLKTYEDMGWGKWPVCMAKTNLSISHNARLKGRPSGYTFEISDVRASAGAGFIYPLAGTMVTMPGLPASPRALDVDEKGNILGL